MAALVRFAVESAMALMAIVLLLRTKPVDASPWLVTTWTPSHATFYGTYDGAETMGGACGYGNLWWRGYGLNTAALSEALFNNGATCGACFQIRCDTTNPDAYGVKFCYKDAAPITITATNHCPPNWAKPSDMGGWCNPPRTHFDLPLVMFSYMAQSVAGIIPVQYRRYLTISRYPARGAGGIKFSLGGNPYFNLVLVHNVAGAGIVTAMQMKGDKTTWCTMTRNWGQNWECHVKFTGQKLSFMVTASNGSFRRIDNLTSEVWYFGQTYEACSNF
ncbi:hypothetical protein R1sor_003629 [Riccia sorocarpa]|uniref:Expansin n=1 Tax=Riccia sorocarpa TaxID=122646 RepID=A0ABD3H248_9MARC